MASTKACEKCCRARSVACSCGEALDPRPRGRLSAAVAGDWNRDRVGRLLWGIWTDGLAARDPAAKQETHTQQRPSQHSSETPHAKFGGVSREFAEMECETKEGALVLEEEFDNDDVLALEECVAATEDDMSMANRTWEEARQLLHHIQKARRVCPVVGLVAIPSGKSRGKGGRGAAQGTLGTLSHPPPRFPREYGHSDPWWLQYRSDLETGTRPLSLSHLPWSTQGCGLPSKDL